LEVKGAPKGRLTVMGTPAEEGLGGKVKLIERGAFNDIDVAMMVHPCSRNVLEPVFLTLAQFKVTFHGKATHVAAFPWEGINALDAAVLAYNNISELRQQLKPTIRISGVISEGGANPSIIPEKSVMEYYIRTSTIEEMVKVKAKVISCFEAAAEATRCTVDIKEPNPSAENMLHSHTVVDLYKANSQQLGLTHVEFTQSNGSTDMGNVSQVVPAIHPMYKIGDGTQQSHTREFAFVTNMLTAYEKTLVVAKAMAMTAIDLFISPELVHKAKDAHSQCTQHIP